MVSFGLQTRPERAFNLGRAALRLLTADGVSHLRTGATHRIYTDSWPTPCGVLAHCWQPRTQEEMANNRFRYNGFIGWVPARTEQDRQSLPRPAKPPVEIKRSILSGSGETGYGGWGGFE